MIGLWRGFEQFLLSQFPDAKRIVTPYHDPEFETEQYRQFLSSLGYALVAQAAYGKQVGRA